MASVQVSMALGFVLLCGSSTRAWAVGSAAPLDLHVFRPAFGEYSLPGIDLPQVGSLLFQGNAWASFQYAHRPLVYKDADGSALDVIKHRLTLDTGFALTLWRQRLEVGMGLPITFFQTGQIPAPGTTNLPLVSFPLPSATLEDIHLLAKGVVFHSQGSSDLAPQGGIGLLGDLTLPTGNANAFSGSRHPTFSFGVLGSFQYKMVTLAAQLGGFFASNEAVLLQPTQEGLPVPSTLQTGLGVVYRLGAQVRVWQKHNVQLLVGAEVLGKAQGPAGNPYQNATELHASFVVQNRWIQGVFGVGPGLSSGAGSADVRVYAGVRVPWPGKALAAKAPTFLAETSLYPTQVLDGAAPMPTAASNPSLFPTGLRCADDTFLPQPVDLLDQIAQLAKAHPEWTPLEVVAHTSNDRSEFVALYQTHRCAHAVVTALEQRGIAHDRAKPIAAGFLCPLASNHTAELRAQNRRVEIRIASPKPFSKDDPCTY